jgi:glycosyltransferase involved in cell wall biosynthesis
MPDRRVGMLFHGYYPTDVRVRREAEALVSAGYEVHVICLRRTEAAKRSSQAREETINGVYVHRLPLERKRGNQLRYLAEYTLLAALGAVKLARLHFHRPFRIVHIHNMPDLLVLAGLLPKWTGAKLLLDVHDPMAELYQANGYRHAGLVTRILNWQQKISCHIADKVISVSESMRENLQNKGVPSDKLFIVHNFPEERFFSNNGCLSVWPRHRDEPILLYCGTITDHYRLDIAVRALAIASKSIPGLRLRIVGEGNRVTEVRRLACELAVIDRVEFIDTVSAEQIPAIMADADIGISTHAGGIFGALYFSNKILEYMSQGLPVIASRTETLVRYIPENAIFYFEPGNAQDMAAKILHVWNDPAGVIHRIAVGRALISRYTWEAEKNKLTSFYADLLRGSSPETLARATG